MMKQSLHWQVKLAHNTANYSSIRRRQQSLEEQDKHKYLERLMCLLLSAEEQTVLRALLCKELRQAATPAPAPPAQQRGLHGNNPDTEEYKVKAQKTEKQKHVVFQPKLTLLKMLDSLILL